MAYFIVDEKHKSIHSHDDIVPKLCQVSILCDKNMFVLFNENEVRELLLYGNYNGCPYCLSKYYLEQMTIK